MIIMWLLISVSCYAIGEYLSKKFAISPSVEMACIIVLMYALGTLAWLPAIHKGQLLATVGTLWNVLSLGITLIIGLVIFHEVVTTTQIIGICFAIISIILLNL